MCEEIDIEIDLLDELDVVVDIPEVSFSSTDVSNGAFTPVLTFNLVGWDYTLDSNGKFIPVFSGDTGEAFRYIISPSGNKFKIVPDQNGIPTPEFIANVGLPPTFWAMFGPGSVVWVKGIDDNGFFTETSLN